MTLDDHLAEFGTRTGLGALRLNDEGMCRLVFDEELTVDIEASPSGKEFTFVAAVGDLAPEAGRATLAKLLDANLMGRGTGGATLALDVLTNEVVLCRTLPAEDLPYRSFETALESFVQALERWTDEIEADDGEVDEDADDPASRPEAARDGEDVVLLRV